MALFVFLLMLYVSQSAAVTVKVYEGHQSVTLPFFTIPLNNDPSALWTRERSSSETVHFRDNDVDDLRRQSPHFRNRTLMKERALETGDLSLTLTHPNASDSGVYSCVVREGTTEVKRTSVELIVISVNVTAVEGAESVSLPCTMTPLNMDPSAQWTREGSQVHLRVKEGDHRLQSPQFKDRTQMNERAFQTGDLSLVLFKTTLEDSGTYTCTVREGSSETGRISVEVKIEPQTDPRPIIRLVVLVLVPLGLLLVVLVGVWYYHKKWMSTEVLVCEGAESVALPFIMKGLDMQKDPSALWSREGSTPERVHFRVKDGDLFKGRAEMMPDSLETGSLTLVLKKPTASDSGTYTCVAKERTTVVKRISVELIVTRSTGVTLKVYEGDESVSLPCIMSELDMYKGPSARWTREGSTPERVHFRVKEGDDLRVKERDDLSNQSPQFINRTEMKKRALQTGDLSLTLKNPTASDTGTYICLVNEGTDLKCTTVNLIVKKKWKYGKCPQWNKKKRNASSVI